MSRLSQALIGPILNLEDGIATMISTSACVPGEVLAVDRAVVDSAYHWTTMKTPAAGATPNDDVKAGVFGVALEVVSAGAKGRFCFQGVVKALGGDTATKGSVLMANTSKQLVQATTLQKGLAYAMETNASGTNQYVMFDGINGFSAI